MQYAVVLSLTVFLALASSPAWAHPVFRPDEVPAGQQTEVELDIIHHCEQTGGVSPTTVVAVQVPDAIAEVVPLELEGWTLDTTRGSDTGRRELEWAAEQTMAEADPPVFRIRVTPDTHETAATIPWKVFQGCEEGSYLWGSGSEEEPPVNLTVTPGVYVAPPSPTPEARSPEPSPTISPDAPATSTPAEVTPSTPPETTPTIRVADDADQTGGGIPRAPLAAAIAIGIGGLAVWAVRQRTTSR